MKALRILMALTLFAAGAAAATPEESYIAARDQYVQQIKALEEKKNGAAAAEMAQKKALADLEKRLEGIIGDLNVKNYPAVGKIMAESLSANDIGYGLLELAAVRKNGQWAAGRRLDRRTSCAMAAHTGGMVEKGAEVAA